MPMLLDDSGLNDEMTKLDLGRRWVLEVDKK